MAKFEHLKFLTIFLTILTVDALNFEKEDYCSICSDHTLCKFEVSKLSDVCNATAEQPKLSDEIKANLVKKHNDLRKRVALGREKQGNPGPQYAAKSMFKLKWDEELETIAQTWANQCIFGHDSCRDTKKGSVGQNVAIHSYVGRLSDEEMDNLLLKMVQLWYDEVSSFPRDEVREFGSGASYTVVGHYTQLIWAKTKRIGCGVILNKESAYDMITLVCNYSPAGNFAGEPVYEIKK